MELLYASQLRSRAALMFGTTESGHLEEVYICLDTYGSLVAVLSPVFQKEDMKKGRYQNLQEVGNFREVTWQSDCRVPHYFIHSHSHVCTSHAFAELRA